MIFQYHSNSWSRVLFYTRFTNKEIVENLFLNKFVESNTIKRKIEDKTIFDFLLLRKL